MADEIKQAETEETAEIKPKAIKPKKSTAEKLYSKDQLIKSKAYHDKRDLLNALLYEDIRYTKSQVDKLVSDYLKRGVN